MVDETLTQWNKLMNAIVGEERGLYEMFWKFKALPLTHLLAGWALKNRVATKNKLYSQRVLLDKFSCVMCSKVEKFVSHLFLTCEMTSIVWNLCYRWVEEHIVQHNVVKVT